MKVFYFAETEEHCLVIQKENVEGRSVLALTVEAMYILDQWGMAYTTPNDYLGLDYFVDVRRNLRNKHTQFCFALDQLIRRKMPAEMQLDELLEPAYWFNKFSYRLMETTICYSRLIEEIIRKEAPEKIVYFSSCQQPQERCSCSDLIFSNAIFISTLLKEFEKEYSSIQWVSIPVEENTTMVDRRVPLHWKQKVINCIPWKILRMVHAMWRKDWSYFTPWKYPGPVVLRMGTNQDIRKLVKNFIHEKQGREIRKEDLKLIVDDTLPHWTLQKFKRYHKKDILDFDNSRVLFTQKELKEVLKSSYPTVCNAAFEHILKKYKYYEKYLKDTIFLYKAANGMFNRYSVFCVIAHSGTDPFNNAVLAAAKKNKIKTYVIQHGGDFGESFHFGETEHTCFAFADYFGLWGPQAQSLTKKYAKSRCEFFYIGKMGKKAKTLERMTLQNPVKKVLFVHNNAFHGYYPLMKDCMWFDIHKKVAQLFSQYPDHQYCLRPSPKGSLTFPGLRKVMQDHVPHLEIMSQGTLSEVCSQVDLVIIDCLSTTLHDALCVKSHLIGLKHPTYVQYYPEIEEKVSQACVFCKTEEDFLKKVEFYLQYPDQFPDVRDGIKKWEEYCLDVSSETDVLNRFVRHCQPAQIKEVLKRN